MISRYKLINCALRNYNFRVQEKNSNLDRDSRKSEFRILVQVRIFLLKSKIYICYETYFSVGAEDVTIDVLNHVATDLFICIFINSLKLVTLVIFMKIVCHTEIVHFLFENNVERWKCSRLFAGTNAFR